MRKPPPISTSSPRATITSRRPARAASARRTAAALLLTTTPSSAPVTSERIRAACPWRSPRRPAARSYSTLTEPAASRIASTVRDAEPWLSVRRTADVATFLDASYIRAVGANLQYGLSARGLAVDTGLESGEEFPVFKSFWLERSQPNAKSMVVHALLDSPSAAGSYRFTIRPGDPTVFDVETALYPRVDIPTAGLAPLTSMFMFDANNRANVDDFRPAVHDSDGLAVHNGRGEQLWRPLTNPADLQISTFVDSNPRGFGLIQRKRDFRDYQDLEAHYEKRPSLWIEPIGDWGEGGVFLVEIPSKEEIHSKLSFLINAPAQRLVTVMNAVGRDVAVVLNQGVEKKKFKEA